MKLYGKFDGEAITEISYNLKAFEEYDDIYYTLVLRYLDTLGVEHGEWGDGIDELWEECNDYLND